MVIVKLVMCFRIFGVIILILSFVVSVSDVAYAQLSDLREATVTIAASIQILDEGEIIDGSVVVSNEEGFVLSTREYQESIYGIVVYDPAVVLNQSDEENTFPVVTNGTVRVRVSGVNGSVKKGDFIVSSNIKGVGMKATRSGFAIGTAIEDYEFANPGDEGLVLVGLKTQNYIAPASVKSKRCF